jgi:hypothetical protein
MITVVYSSIDRVRKSRSFKTLAGASKFAVSMLGQHPEFGTGYAVSDDGVGKIEVRGCSLAELFAVPGAATSADGYRIEAKWDGYEGYYLVMHGTRILGTYDDEIEAQSHIASAREYDALPPSEKEANRLEAEAEAVAHAGDPWPCISVGDDDEMPF